MGLATHSKNTKDPNLIDLIKSNINVLFCSVQALGQAPSSSHQGNGPGKIANASLSGLALAARARGNNLG